MVDKKIAEMNMIVGENEILSVPAVQGTEMFSTNTRIMRSDLLTQEDGGTDCSKWSLFYIL